MSKDKDRIIERDCARFMRFPTIALIIAELLALFIPSVSAFLIGDMGEQLLNGNRSAVLSQLGPFLCSVILIAFVTPFAEYIQNLFLTKYGFAYDAFLTDRFIRMPMLSAQKKELGELMERLEEDSAVYCFYQVLKRGRSLVMVIYLALLFALVMKREYDLIYTLIIFIMAAIPLVWANYAGKREAVLSKEYSEYNEKRKNLEQTLYLSRQFYLFYHLSSFIREKLDSVFQDYLTYSGRKRIRFLSLSSMMDFFMSNGIRILLIVFGSSLMAAGRISVGELLGGILLYPSISKWYGYGTSLLKNLKHEKECRGRIGLFYETDLEASSEDEREINQIVLHDISFSYDGERGIIQHRNERLLAGKSYQILGPNGSGKTTLLKLIGGLYVPSEGTVTDDQGNVLGIGCLRKNVSFQEQNGTVFSGTVFDNLFVDESARPRAEEVLKTLCFDKPIDEMLTEAGGNLSPGERKKLLLARSLLKEAPFLILDEPLNHLDVAGESGLLSLIKRRKHGLIVASHRSLPGIEIDEYLTGSSELTG